MFIINNEKYFIIKKSIDLRNCVIINTATNKSIKNDNLINILKIKIKNNYLSLIFTAGLPSYIEYSSKLFLATDEAVSIDPFLQVTPCKTIDLAQIHDSDSIFIGLVIKLKVCFL
tara:strand:- start:31 stop:375 length:345 start_codon:yes stop_codon:yes gene_type:complete